MNAKIFIDKMAEIQSNLLEYIDNEEQNPHEFIFFLKEKKIQENQDELESFLCLVVKISNHHHRTSDFFDKIGQILTLLKQDIMSHFTNYHIFNLFKSNKRLILLLIKEKMITINQSIVSFITHGKYTKLKYPQYFFPEIKAFLDDKTIETISKEIPEDLERKREQFSSTSYLYNLIQNDSIEEFVSYVNKTNTQLSSTIDPTILETDTFLLENSLTLIQYAVYFGSIQVLQYLIMNDISLSPDLWTYAIHGQNAAIIHLLEENHIFLSKQTHQDCIISAIKCHHNAIKNYLEDNFNFNIEIIKHDFEMKSLRYHNYAYISESQIDKSVLYQMCQYNYPIFLKSKIDLKSILIQILIYHFKSTFLNEILNHNFFDAVFKINSF